MKSRVHKILLPLLSSLLLLLVIMPGCAAVTPVPTAPVTWTPAKRRAFTDPETHRPLAHFNALIPLLARPA